VVVSIHAPAWGATLYVIPGFPSRESFNPRARVGRDPSTCSSRSARASFNPRARVGRDLIRPDLSGCIFVSIHAPAWGATHPTLYHHVLTLVSIHAPAWGATGEKRVGNYLVDSFNPRARVGRDTIAVTVGAGGAGGFNPRARVGRDACADELDALGVVSIHAPAWGATQIQPLEAEITNLFQSTRPRGARHNIILTAYVVKRFQSTRPRGARR